MEVTFKQLYEANSALKEIYKKEVPIKASLKLLELIKEVDTQIILAEEKRQELVIKYKDTKENKVADDNLEMFKKEFFEMLEAKTQINWEPVDPEFFGDCKISTEVISKIRFLLM